MMHLIHTGLCQSYVSETVQLITDRSSHTDLRSASTSRYILLIQDCALSLGSASSRSLALRMYSYVNQLYMSYNGEMSKRIGTSCIIVAVEPRSVGGLGVAVKASHLPTPPHQPTSTNANMTRP